jgi:hypothetical protein
LGAAVIASASFLVIGGGAAGAIECAADPAIADGDPGSLRNLLENDDASGCTSVVLTAGATYVLDDVQGDVDIYAAMVIEGNGATIQQTVSGQRVLDTTFELTIRNVTVTGGRLTGGSDGGGLETDFDPLTVEGVTFRDNATDGEGGALEVDGPTTIRNSTFVDNRAAEAGAIDADDDVTLIASTVARNCALSDGSAAEISDAFVVVNSTITENVGGGGGALDMDDAELTLVYSDVVRNTLDDDVDCPLPIVNGDNVDGAAEGELPEEDESAEDAADEGVEAQAAGEASNIEISGPVLAFGTVVAEPLLGAGEPGPAINCEGEPTETTSSGYNFSDDATCGFLAATDRQSAGSPLLGPLADNGGPTQTLLPLALSPLENAIPLASCGDGNGLAGFPVTTDQRGVGRPQGAGCEIGSVEIELVLSFTG